MTSPKSPRASGRLNAIAPALLGASSFAAGDVLSKFTINAGADALTVSAARGVLGLVLLFAWLRLRSSSFFLEPRPKWISLALGLVFALNVFLLFEAFANIEVPVAILTYFVYPLVTGIIAAATGLEALTWRGVTAAFAAFLGLALMIGAHPTALALGGVVAALGAAGCRVLILLVTRAALQGIDARLITWYSLVSSTAVLVLATLGTSNWQPPTTASGWVALSATVTGGMLGVFASTGRIGPFRTALFMNLEPPLATIGSALLLGELITPVQALGGAVMIAALVAFQLRR